MSITLRRFTQASILLWSAAITAPAVAVTAADLPPPKGCDIVGPISAPKALVDVQAEVFPPVQLDISTPLEPTVFAASGRNYLLYELHLRNYADETLTLRGIEVINAQRDKGQMIVDIGSGQLKQRVRVIGGDAKDAAPRLASGQSAVAFLCLAFDGKATVPEKLRHRVVLDGAIADGPVIGTRHNSLHIFGPPLSGTNWTADNGPSLDSHHRTGLFVAGGQAQLSRRYAIDWKKYKDGRSYSGDARDVNSYYSYGQEVLAVADGTVEEARDGQPNNVPRTMAGFTPAVPVTMDNIAGNFIVINLGAGQFAQYAHLQPGSLRVKTGDRVKRGQVLARIGNSGDARVPHLHFQVATNRTFLASEGVPFLLDRYRLQVGESQWELRMHEFPIGGAVIDFVPQTNVDELGK